MRKGVPQETPLGLEQVFRIKYMSYHKKLIILIFVIIPFSSYANDIFQDTKDRDIEAIKARINRGEDINQVDKWGYSPLMLAAKYQQIEMVQLLLDNGADIHIRDRKMQSTVVDDLYHWISRSGQERLRKIEYSKKLGTSQAIIDGSYPARTRDGVDFTETGQELWREILALIESRIEVNDGDVESHEEPDEPEPDQINPKIRAMADFLDKGYDINIQAANGETMLMRAVTEGNPEMVSYLLSRGIDPDLRDNEGRTAFEYIDAISDEDLKQKMKSAFHVNAHETQEVVDHQISENVIEIPEVVKEVAAPEPAILGSAEVAPVEVVDQTPEKSSQWWLWLIGAVIAVGGILKVCRKK